MDQFKSGTPANFIIATIAPQERPPCPRFRIPPSNNVVVLTAVDVDAQGAVVIEGCNAIVAFTAKNLDMTRDVARTEFVVTALAKQVNRIISRVDIIFNEDVEVRIIRTQNQTGRSSHRHT
ncbi:hypothetical protein OOK60_13580 [Trichothermofontia sichuanensis B231]|uniref:hypothetical protein n=1 Tax=Trichothermofontia sichuanensis TaxID=3045816 RepID=UPI0022453AD9|nr:hypothetical protein [Trichothermofontia sichuanensis]UZQ53522.1 hypothetical protein OOK60_13580 [Trichothermofontia sichuanensis B231]